MISKITIVRYGGAAWLIEANDDMLMCSHPMSGDDDVMHTEKVRSVVTTGEGFHERLAQAIKNLFENQGPAQDGYV